MMSADRDAGAFAFIIDMTELALTKRCFGHFFVNEQMRRHYVKQDLRIR